MTLGIIRQDSLISMKFVKTPLPILHSLSMSYPFSKLSITQQSVYLKLKFG